MVRDIPFLSSSIINDYIGCKRSFLEFYRSDGFKTYRNNDEDGEAIYLMFGTLIHGVIEQFWKGNNRTKKFLIKTYEHDLVEFGLTDKSYIELGYEIINNFFSYLLNEAPKRKMLHSELSFKVDIEGVPLHGTIDAVFYHGNGIYEIEDYKTSNWIPTQAEVDENIQLSMYDLVFSNDVMKDYWFHGIKPTGIILTLHYLRRDVRVQTERTQYSRLSAINYFRLIYKQMQVLDDTKFVPNVNIFCSYCSHSDVCEAYQSILSGEYEVSTNEMEDINEQNIRLYNEYNAMIKVLEEERNNCYGELVEYLSQPDAIPIEYNGYLWYVKQGGRRYVKKDKMIKILKDNGIWDEDMEKQFVSIPVTTIDHIIKKHKDLESELQSAIGYSYNNPSLTSEKAPKLFKRSGGGKHG